MHFMKTMAAALAVTVGAATFADSADARHRRHHNDAFIAGAVGFGAGALLGSALSQPRYRYYEPSYQYYEPRYQYYEPAPVYVRPAPVYAYSREPWTEGWYAYCESRYQSFDPRSGYFLGYDGQYHFCR